MIVAVLGLAGELGPQHWGENPAAFVAPVGTFAVLSLLAMSAAVLWRRCGRGSRAGSEEERVPGRRSDQPAWASGTGARPVLASDAERDAAGATVSHAIGEGRLSLDEGTQRIDAVYRARHRHQLAALVADLPPPLQRSGRDGAHDTVHSVAVALAAALVLAACLVQALAGLWELWPVAVAAAASPALVGRR